MAEKTDEDCETVISGGELGAGGFGMGAGGFGMSAGALPVVDEIAGIEAETWIDDEYVVGNWRRGSGTVDAATDAFCRRSFRFLFLK